MVSGLSMIIEWRGTESERNDLRWLIDRTPLRYTTTLSYPKPVVTKLLSGRSGKRQGGVLNDKGFIN